MEEQSDSVVEVVEDGDKEFRERREPREDGVDGERRELREDGFDGERREPGEDGCNGESRGVISN